MHCSMAKKEQILTDSLCLYNTLNVSTTILPEKMQHLVNVYYVVLCVCPTEEQW